MAEHREIISSILIIALFSFTYILKAQGVANEKSYHTVSQLSYDSRNQTYQSSPKQTSFSIKQIGHIISITL